MEVMTLRMDEADIKTLDGLCEERAKSRSEILRVVVKRGLKEEAGPDPRPAPIFWAPVAADAAMIFDWYRTVPGLRLAIINRAISDLVNLSDDIPRLWAQACLTMSPAQAELHVLEIVKARRDAIGAACLKDLGENFWEPEGN